MKILCETQIFNRQTNSNKPKTAKATVAIGFHPTTKQDNKSTLELIHFTPQNRNGVRYKISDNIENMFTKFINDGKATISFKTPPENLMIKCDPIQLKSFLQTLKLGLQGKSSMNLKSNLAAATAIPVKSQPITKIVVTKRAEYPLKGFPRSLKQLTVNGIGLHKVTFEICSLTNLTTLKLNDNSISKIPNEFGRLRLIELDLSNNALGEDTNFRWLIGKELKKTLCELDLSNNKLDYFPIELIKLENVVTLKLSHNSIKKVPFGIRGMKNLRYLHLSTNKLESLPSSIDEVKLELLDVWENNFQPICEKTVEGRLNVTNSPQSLWLMAANAVSNFRLPISSRTLPWILVDLICESPKCFCGRLCYGEPVWERAIEATLDNIKQLVFSRDRLIYADIVVCSAACAAKKAIF
ncbi:leucine-rich repeat protein 1 [Episyrphus balteatus]|uniref:leucine-rich repeat protein 1 n=1 Tax=Episyrphus balteatus TaxID=286459 RepID=UPI0024858CA5|nr:leucine-rich repeat protein 1 [Episyrphus balteatus]